MTISVKAIQTAAENFGLKIKVDSPINKLFISEVDHREELKRSVARVMLAIDAEFGDILVDLPMPDSGPEGNNPDLYEESKGKGNAKRKGSFWGDAALSASAPRQWVKYKKDLQYAMSKEGSSDPAAEQFWKRGPQWLKAELAQTTQRITAVQNLFRNGARALAKKQIIEEEFSGINVSVQMDEKTGDVARVTKPFLMWADAKPAEDGKPAIPSVVYYFSAGEFLALDLDKAKEMGGTIEAIRKSGERGTPNGGHKAVDVQSVKTFMDVTVGMLAYLDEENNITKLVNHLVKEENKDDARYVAETYLLLDSILKGYPKVHDVFMQVTNSAPKKAETKAA